jgi:hypothetical protein
MKISQSLKTAPFEKKNKRLVVRAVSLEKEGRK